jgi:methionyl-tRNA formyltransferase
MQIDEQMDHGPIVAERNIKVTEWPIYEEFESTMAIAGANLLAEILPDWEEGKIQAVEQNHEMATYTKKITKQDGLIDLDADPYTNFRKIQAYHDWPIAYFMIKHNNRDLKVKITQASYTDGALTIERAIPEGKKEMPFDDFKRGYYSK